MTTRTFSSTREWDFEDSNGDVFLVYDHRQTQEYWGTKNVGVDYNDYKSRKFRRAKKLYPSMTDFWESNELHELRVYGTKYSDGLRFKKWMLRELEKFDSEDSLSYEQ